MWKQKSALMTDSKPLPSPTRKIDHHNNLSTQPSIIVIFSDLSSAAGPTRQAWAGRLRRAGRFGGLDCALDDKNGFHLKNSKCVSSGLRWNEPIFRAQVEPELLSSSPGQAPVNEPDSRPFLKTCFKVSFGTEHEKSSPSYTFSLTRGRPSLGLI